MPESVTALRRVVIVSRVKRNPYVVLLCEGLRQAELGIEPSVVDEFSLAWVWRHRRDVDWLHMQWLELFFTYPTFYRSFRRWLSVISGLVLARLLGVGLVYTVHNIWQHEGKRARLARWANSLMFSLADSIHVHDRETAQELSEGWRRVRSVFVIPHGSYVLAYPNNVTRSTARESLGLGESDFVYLFLGRVRPYKGLETLLHTFGQLSEQDAVLLVAGEVHDPGYERELVRIAAGDPRIRLHLAYVPEQDLQIYFNASDVSVLPYRHVTTSGAAVLSFSFNVPIIAPSIGCFRDLVGENQKRGILYESVSDVDASAVTVDTGLLRALVRARAHDLAGMRTACHAYAESIDWKTIARQHAMMYRRDDEEG